MALFLDTNIVLYAFGSDKDKRDIALGLMAQSPIISTQVINECSHVLRRKLRWDPEKVAEEMENLLILVQLKTYSQGKVISQQLVGQLTQIS